MDPRRWIAGLGLALGLAACVPEDGPSMRPGEDCLQCHNGQRAGAWTVAGTIFSDPNAPATAGQEGAQIIVTDAANKVLTMTSNSAGNFYTAEDLTFPISVVVQRGSQRIIMQSQQTTGACNVCHNIPVGQQGTPGRVFVPFTSTTAARHTGDLLRTALQKKS